MNRSVLIVIVDFLLISLLAFSRLDQTEVPPETKAPAEIPPINLSSSRQDMAELLKVSLEKERASREQLDEQLRLTQAQLQIREQSLDERERAMREAERLLKQKADEAARLAKERAAMERQFQVTQASVAELQKQLTNTLTEASTSRQNLEAVRADLAAREQEEALLKRRLAQLEDDRKELAEERNESEEEKQLLAAQLEAVEVEKRLVREQTQKLATQLEVAETEKRLVRERLSSVQGEVQVERQEKARLQEHAARLQEHATKLAEGVTALAEKSSELTDEIRENRPLPPNAVFNEFVTNRVLCDFRAVRSGVFGREINRQKESKTVLVRQDGQVYAIYHVNDTPLTFSFPGIDWDWLLANLRRGETVVRIDRVSFLAIDPRVVVVPIPEARARDLGTKIYPIPKDPFKFQQAILIGANEGYYGECTFQVDPDNAQYVRMQRERFSWLAGKFAPSSGDLVFTKGGELLGVMVNKEYCLLLTSFSPVHDIQMGVGLGNQKTGMLLSQLFGQIARMPARLQ